MRKLLLLIAIYPFIFFSCGSDKDDTQQTGATTSSQTANKSSVSTKQLNINVLWDLSDRIDTSKSPSSPQQYEKDLEIIKEITLVLKNDMDHKGAYLAKGKLKVFFTPTPEDQNINKIAQNLIVDLASFSGEGASKEKKSVYDTITPSFYNNALEIYKIASKNNAGKQNWDGSDIWRFFKDDADKVIESDTNYRNILIILTDGYIYHKDSKEKSGNRTQYILPSTLQNFRGKNNWKELFDAGDYGLMSTGNTFPNLEVLVLEVKPTEGNKNDEDYIKAYLEKWFNEMKISNYKIYNTDLPAYTKKRVEEFINK